MLIPVLNLKAGAGLARGFLKKNDPITSPTRSATNLIGLIVACAPLLVPKTVALFLSIYPKNDPCASSDKDLISIFKTLEDAE